MARTGVLTAVFALGVAAGVTLTIKIVHGQVTGAPPPAVTGIGGVFFKADDPQRLRDWYRRHLGIDAGEQGYQFTWREEGDAGRSGMTVWSLFARDSDYFGRETQEFMVNYRVADLDTLLTRLEQQGVHQVKAREDYWYGRFAWIDDVEGNRIELWEPADLTPEEIEQNAGANAGG